MTQQMTVYFKNAAGEVHPVTLPEIEARLACRKHAVEWSLTGDGHAPAPEGFVFSEGAGGGRGRIAGASVRAD